MSLGRAVRGGFGQRGCEGKCPAEDGRTLKSVVAILTASRGSKLHHKLTCLISSADNCIPCALRDSATNAHASSKGFVSTLDWHRKMPRPVFLRGGPRLPTLWGRVSASTTYHSSSLRRIQISSSAADSQPTSEYYSDLCSKLVGRSVTGGVDHTPAGVNTSSGRSQGGSWLMQHSLHRTEGG